MNKSKLIETSTFPLIFLGIFLSSAAYIPLLRVIIGLDSSISMSFSTTIVFLVAGYMASLAGLIAWSRKINAEPIINASNTNSFSSKKPHYLGLIFLIPIPFISCLFLIWFWRKDRLLYPGLDDIYRQTINFHLAIHLYLLLSFFLMPVVLGFFMIVLLFMTMCIATVFNIVKSSLDVKYPINIKILTNQT